MMEMILRHSTLKNKLLMRVNVESMIGPKGIPARRSVSLTFFELHAAHSIACLKHYHLNSNMRQIFKNDTIQRHPATSPPTCMRNTNDNTYSSKDPPGTVQYFISSLILKCPMINFSVTIYVTMSD